MSAFFLAILSRTLSPIDQPLQAMPESRGVGLWLPAPPDFIARWFTTINTSRLRRDTDSVLPVIQEFKQLIENDTTLFMYFTSMFDEIPSYSPYDKDVIGNPQIRDYQHMLQSFNEVIQTLPPWNDAANNIGFCGFPINAILNWPMGTPSGRSAFLDPRVNAMLKKMLTVWAGYLVSPASTNVLNTNSDGWLSPNAVRALTTSANLAGHEEIKFHDLYACDPSKPCLVYTYWDNFFTRTFKDGIRPISSPNDDSILVSPCEAAPYRLANDVSERATFWIKAQPYSLNDMLANDELVSRFVDGTVYQAFLSSLSYHRWHSPISGTVVKAYNIPGAYYSETLLNSFAGEGADPEATMRSRAYITAVATRAVIFIPADNDDIGLVCVLFVGMAEVSSCEINVYAGQHLVKGQEIGMFHFGGSTFCLIFQKDIDLCWEEDCLPPYPENMPNIAVRRKLATIRGVGHPRAENKEQVQSS
ncbi:Phophatidylserine decarboxylase-domain-containing protein [Crepidotus variabilis]|uniref:Phophatidylserine decarboxylase-domain-containing protein n=1 Tax=Crepidotus variabilis TaxID=179855 RepID=A0A9P6EMC4_9AGAR|nr:Phophatidylserine decarboxylase-domain-containing protein [Crepidotus variabilis]